MSWKEEVRDAFYRFDDRMTIGGARTRAHNTQILRSDIERIIRTEIANALYGLVPEDQIWGDRGFNECRSEVLKRIEAKRKELGV